MERKPKTIFQLDTPYTTFQWPNVSSEDQETILTLLLSLLSPIGRYRLDHITPSEGKRSRKRKRKEAQHVEKPAKTKVIPPPPEILPFIVVGINNVTRRLGIAAQCVSATKTSSQESGLGDSLGNAPTHSGSSDQQRGSILPEETVDGQAPEGRYFEAIFVSSTPQSSILHAHIPQLIVSASMANPQPPTTRLIQLPEGCDEKICAALGVPRASVIGILDAAPYSKALTDFILEKVPSIDIPWLREASQACYRQVKINIIKTNAPAGKAKDKSVLGVTKSSG